MSTVEKIHIGILTPHAADRPHFGDLRALVPEKIALTIESIGLSRDSGLAGRTDLILQRATEIVRDHGVQGLIVTGAPTMILNPGLEHKLAQAVAVPVTTAVRATTAALRAMGAAKLILMTPFDDAMNSMLEERLERGGFAVLSCPSLEHLGARTGTNVPADHIFSIVEKIVREAPGADAVYFQGAPFNPLPVIERIERELKLPVVASNPAMVWHLLSTLGHKLSIRGYGKLLADWPPLAEAA
ncbi:MAG TPA: hypothetical protein VNL14_08565 [Candidatus Acidoferrales bacterium]|nr:hypothetical protein [Candidatus Acidoferrales bacterium]